MPARHQVEDATTADAGALADLLMHSFTGDHFSRTFPRENGVGRAYHYAAMLRTIEMANASKAQDWVESGKASPAFSVIRDENGIIRAAAIHWILPRGTAAENFPAWSERWGAAIPGMSEDELESFFGEMQESHRDVMGDVPHVYLLLAMTDSSVRRKGYGSALVEHGIQLASKHNWAAFLHASEDGLSLYRRLGYEDQDESKQSNRMWPMIKPPPSVTN